VLSSEIYAPLHPETLADPYPIFRRLQVEAPVAWHDKLCAWVLSRYDDCSRVLRSSVDFSRDPAKLLGVNETSREGMTIQSHDPPDSIPLRQALAITLDRIDVATVCRGAGDRLKQCLARQPVDRPFDFMSDAAAPAALHFACRLIGVPEIASETYESIFVRVTRAMDSSLDGNRYNAGREATHELNELILAALPVAAPGSVIYDLNLARGVREMSAGYVRNTIAAMFNAAYSTAHASMGSFLALSLERPGLARRIVDSGQVTKGVQELLRFTSPAQATMRYCARDTVISGITIRKMEPIVTLMAAANRDPKHFVNPDDLVLDRSPNPHLGFGWGPHFCVGAMPAQRFLEHFVRQLADWESEFALAGEPRWLDTATLRCLARLPVSRQGQSPVNERVPPS
jgi:cytochrome P450